MKIKVINPNTTVSMTQIIGSAARSIASSTTEIIACNPAMGPVSIEGHYDEALSAIGILDEIRKGEAEKMDGYVIACFGDPGLMAARELARGPVIGIAEAAMHAASFIATGFSIVTTLGRTRVIAQHLVERYGMTRFCRQIRSIDLSVLNLEEAYAKTAVLAECRMALKEDDCGAIILGCAGMADLSIWLSNELGIPVIDGVSVAVKFVEALVGAGLGTSKTGDLAYPISKPYTGIAPSP
ncbi:aspartate/glutamate racemase family protein [Argonema antarcticum]|uniref:aspartate/glutamate racemase family protein n=1 Tax=Argonema antarcticum TaxID=2942763 RepID=UPI002012B759|nr:aspartate/glutamate racemase family protein [Argonema antarcticum]MCL1472226.1 aspartate/glutamate racemase family protein [Argonema antarcticum A004/B2]